MNVQPTHQFLTSAVLTSACRFRQAVRHQATEWSAQLSRLLIERRIALRALRHQDRKTATRDLGRAVGQFLCDTFLRSPARMLRTPVGKRTAGFMLAGLIPLLAACSLVALPGLIFNHPEQRAYFFFARVLQSDAASLVPFALGMLSLVAALRFPLQTTNHDQHAS
jgi:hypothetical protein